MIYFKEIWRCNTTKDPHPRNLEQGSIVILLEYLLLFEPHELGVCRNTENLFYLVLKSCLCCANDNYSNGVIEDMNLSGAFSDARIVPEDASVFKFTLNKENATHAKQVKALIPREI